MSTKIHLSHLQRDAYVYVRQSTGHQVCAHPLKASDGNMPSRSRARFHPRHRDR